MTEYQVKLADNGSTWRFPAYGKILRLRWVFRGTVATGKYWSFTIGSMAGAIQQKFYFYTSPVTDLEKFERTGSMDVNIDIDKDDILMLISDATSPILDLWYDFVPSTSGKKRQFADQLSGLNNSPGGYAT